MFKIKFFFTFLFTVIIILFSSLTVKAFGQNNLTRQEDSQPFYNSLPGIAMIAITFITIVFLVAGACVAVTAIKNSSNESPLLINSFMTSSNALKIFTITAVLVGVIFLGLANRLTEGSIALLSSVGGYVLGTAQQPISLSKEKSKGDITGKDPTDTL
jgi:heme/copper-type cytochrome/quinol oxidase subunit 2